MRVAFMGTPEFASRILEVLISSNHQVVGCFTRPDAVRGRGKKLIPSPVKETAVKAQIPVFEFASMRSDEAFEALQSLEVDVACVAAYGAILPKRVLDLPRFGCLNVHGSLLPRWRGAAPIERAILAGDECTGIGIMRMEEGLDTGATAMVRDTSVAGKCAEELSAELANMGAEALVEALDMLEAGKPLEWQEQGAEGVTYAEKIAKGELDIAPELSADEAWRRVLSSSESHACRCIVGGRSLAVLAANPVAPGECPAQVSQGGVAFAAKRLFLGCDNSILELISVKPDGKKPMEAKAFAAGIQGIKQGGIEWQEIHG